MICMVVMLIAACAPDPSPPIQNTPPKQVPFVTDGDVVISNPGVIVNKYAALQQNANSGDNRLVVGTALAGLNLIPGDLLLVVQMQGAQMDTTDTNAYGTITNYHSAGLFEWVHVKQIITSMGVIEIENKNGGLQNQYDASGHVQIVRVPQYGKLTIQAGASVAAPAWDGKQGGVIAVQAQTLLLDGTVDASGLGFRAGMADAGTTITGTNKYVSLLPQDGAPKGEGIAGFVSEYDLLQGRYGRGAPANGGGGGDAYKAGGGGGANGSNGNLWNGQGVMDVSLTDWQTAWKLDPFYVTNAIFANASGGGRGGYSQSLNVLDPTATGPGQAPWGGDARKEVGGLGGHSLNSTGPNLPRLFLGGGGGAGHHGGGTGFERHGGRGGGMICISAKEISGIGTLQANGEAGESAAVSYGAGGGGGGGSIFVNAKNLQGIQLLARGGNGGSHDSSGAEANGPGGGGGGGFVAFSGGTITVDVAAGLAGNTASASMTKFLPNGATQGALGKMNNLPNGFTDLFVTLETVQNELPEPTQSMTYAINVYNQGPSFVQGAKVSGILTPSYPNVSWVCQTQQADLASCATASGTGDVNTLVDLAPGTYVRIVVIVPIPSYVVNDTATYKASVVVPMGVVDLVPANNQTQHALQSSGDASISIVPNTQFLQDQVPIEYTISVHNDGPYCTRGLTVRTEVPPGSVVQDASGPDWSCTQTLDVVECTRAELSCTHDAVLRLVLLPPPHAKEVVVTTTVFTVSPDPDLTNNTAISRLALDDLNRNTLAGGGLGKGCNVKPDATNKKDFGPLGICWMLLLGMLGVRKLLRKAGDQTCS